MPTKAWMRPDTDLGSSPEPLATRAAHEEVAESRGLLEIVLATAGLAAWLWCAIEVARTLFR